MGTLLDASVSQSEQAEERSVSRDELSAGVTLKAGHAVVLLLGGVPGGPPDATGADGTGGSGGTGPSDATGDSGGTGAPDQPGGGTAGEGTSGATSEDAKPGVVRIEVLSRSGKPRDGLVLEWTLPSGAKVGGRTDASGKATLDDSLPAEGEVALEAPDVVGAAAAAGPGHVAYAPGMKVPIGATTVIELPPRVHRARLKGLHFETNKTFLLPSAMRGIRQLRLMYESYGALALLVSGHTDTVGDARSNLGLSEERAASIAAFLTEDVEAWVKNYKPQAHSSAWGTREDQYMLATVKAKGGAPFYALTVDGQAGSGTQAAWKALQGEAGLPQTGQADEATRRALVTRYQALDGTTLPKTAALATHGCGLTHLAVPTGPNVANAENRRVELYLFEDAVSPPPQTPCPAGGCAEYAAWSAASALTVDLDAEPGGLVVQVQDAAGAPVAGADVHLSGPAASDRQTGADGKATFEELIAGPYKVIASKAGAQAAEADAAVAEGSSKAPATLVVRLAAEPPVAASLTPDTSQHDLLQTGTFVLRWKVDRFVAGTAVALACDRDPDGKGRTRPAACDAGGEGSLELTLHDTGAFEFTLSVGPAGAASTRRCTVTFDPTMKIHDVRPVVPPGGA